MVHISVPQFSATIQHIGKAGAVATVAAKRFGGDGALSSLRPPPNRPDERRVNMPKRVYSGEYMQRLWSKGHKLYGRGLPTARWNCDEELARMRFDPRNIRDALRQWANAKWEPTGPLSKDRLRDKRETVKTALRWLHDLDRAIELKLPEAAAKCALDLAEVFDDLNRYFDLYPAHNLLAEDIQSRRRKSAEKARKANAKRAAVDLPGRIRKAWKVETAKGKVKREAIVCAVAAEVGCGESTVRKYAPKRKKNSARR
jgi:hypothetical protein